MRTALILDLETGIKTRHLWIDAKEMLSRDPGRYQLASAPQKSISKVTVDGVPGEASVGRLSFGVEGKDQI